MLTCKNAIEIIGDYLEAELGASAAADLEHHLDECDECAAFLNTYQRTRELAAATVRAEMPTELRTRLRTFLIARLSAREARGPTPS